MPDSKQKVKLPKLAEKRMDDRVFFVLRMLRRARNPRIITTLVLYVVVCAALMSRFFGGVVLKPGDISREDVASPATVSFVDRAATAAARERAASRVGSVYKLPDDFQKKVDGIFSTTLEYLGSGRDAKERDRAEEKLAAAGLSSYSIRTLLNLRIDEPSKLRLRTSRIVEGLTGDGMITETEKRELDDILAGYAKDEGIDSGLVPVVTEIIKKSAGELELDKEATDFRRKEAMDSVRPVMTRIQENEMVIRKGEKATQRHIDIMREIGLTKAGLSWPGLAGYVLLIGMSFLIVGIFLKTFVTNIYRDEKRLLIFFIIVLISVLWGVLVDRMLDQKYLIGVSAGMMTILTCLLLNASVAMFAVPVLLLTVSLVLGLDTGHFIVALFCFLAAYYHSVRTQDRDSLLKAGVSIAAASALVILVMTLMKFKGSNTAFYKAAFLDIFVFGGMNGLLSFVLATGLLPVFERLFSVTTPRRLLELSNPEEPLLKRLLIEAPGTYHHSLLVGNIAESAAEAVGADALLVRIACYYHDVGKLKRPYFFTENQIVEEDRHVDMAPTLAALVISSHVKDGVEMAQDSGLPDDIVEIISQHHGTCLISFFYQQAQSEAKEGSAVTEERFRYPGPRPMRIESAILMLADSCEAAVRSQKTPTPRSIESTVNNLFEARLRDGQFDGCNVTLKQLGEIKIAITKTLARVYHSRIEYPDLEELKQLHREQPARRNGDK